MKYLTLSWDDGFLESSIKTIEIFNKYKLRTEFNVVANFAVTNPKNKFADFGFWNDAVKQGHVVQPHGFNHSNLCLLPAEQAISNIEKSLQIFQTRLEGFKKEKAVFNFPYNLSKKTLEDYLIQENIPFRTGGTPINALPNENTLKLTTAGGEESEKLFDKFLSELYQTENGWLIYNVHGLDGEGFGPMRSSFLEEKLQEVLGKSDVEILPAVEILKKYK